jgi:hypothetical protein
MAVGSKVFRSQIKFSTRPKKLLKDQLTSSRNTIQVKVYYIHLRFFF